MLVGLHAGVATAVVLYMLILGLWGLASALRGAGVTESYRGALVIGEALTIAQALIGVLLVIGGYRPHDALHFLYGVLVPLIIPFAYGLVRAQPPRRAALYYGIATLFIVGLAIRAVVTGR
ncbi:MAG TPA: hypothetical protein VMU89_02975 [Thermomicrobiaceae bacterium]|nr:hypothetical protein [Thermomicrobiaceae bacterium]